MLLMHRQFRAFFGATLVPAFTVCVLAVAERVAHPVLHGIADVHVSVIIVSLALTQGYHDLYTDWGISLRHATVLGVPLKIYVDVKTVSALVLIVQSNVIAASLCMATGKVGCGQFPVVLIYSMFMSMTLLLIWNLWYQWPPLIHRQAILVFISSLAFLCAASIIFSTAVAHHSALGSLLTVLSILLVMRGTRSVWPHRLTVVRCQILEAF